jgi:nucleoside-diphosphate-sugar epimerase
MTKTNRVQPQRNKATDSAHSIPVLLTGPSGRVGPHLVEDFEERYDLRTFDLKPSDRTNSFVGTLASVESLRAAMRGVEVVVHLAATSDEAPFIEELVPNNVVGLYNVFEAARQEGVRRIVFASSVQAVGQGLNQVQAAVETDVNHPNSLYGVTKVLGEVMGLWYHDHHDLEFVALRIGWFQDYPEKHKHSGEISNIWLSPRDLISLVQKAIETPDVGYAVVNGTSNPLSPVLSLQSAYDVLGYQPMDDAWLFEDEVKERSVRGADSHARRTLEKV